MDTASFEYLLEKVTPLIEKSNARMRDSIPPAKRLALTLRFLATATPNPPKNCRSSNRTQTSFVVSCELSYDDGSTQHFHFRAWLKDASDGQVSLNARVPVFMLTNLPSGSTFEVIISSANKIGSSEEVRLETTTLQGKEKGETHSSLNFVFRIPQSTISGILTTVSKAIFHVLKDDYLHCLTTEVQWKKIAEDFHSKWSFPMCIGTMDGKHVKIMPPPCTGSTLYNYKGDFTIVLLAVVDAYLRFVYVDVGTNGRISDGGVWAKTKSKKHWIPIA